MTFENRGIAIVAYMSFIGWAVAIFYHSKGLKTRLGAFHLRQALGLHLLWILFIGLQFLFTFSPVVGKMLNMCITLGFLFVFLLWIVGFAKAATGREDELPLVGGVFEKYLKKIIKE